MGGVRGVAAGREGRGGGASGQTPSKWGRLPELLRLRAPWHVKSRVKFGDSPGALGVGK